MLFTSSPQTTIYGEDKGILAPTLSSSLSPSSYLLLLLRVFNIFGMFKPACFYCCVCWMCSRSLFKVKQLFKNITQRSAQGWVEWQCSWNSMDKYLGHWTSPVFWNVIPEPSTESWNTSEIFGKSVLSPWQFLRDTNHCNMLGPDPHLLTPVQHYSETSRGRDGLWIWQQNDGHCGHSSPGNRHCR